MPCAPLIAALCTGRIVNAGRRNDSPPALFAAVVRYFADIVVQLGLERLAVRPLLAAARTLARGEPTVTPAHAQLGWRIWPRRPCSERRRATYRARPTGCR